MSTATTRISLFHTTIKEGLVGNINLKNIKHFLNPPKKYNFVDRDTQLKRYKMHRNFSEETNPSLKMVEMAPAY